MASMKIILKRPKKYRLAAYITLFYILIHFFALRYYLLNDGLIGLNWDWYIPYLHESMKTSFERTMSIYVDINWGKLKVASSIPQALLYLVGYLLKLDGSLLSKVYLITINVLASISFCLFTVYYLKMFVPRAKFEHVILTSFFAGLFYGLSPAMFFTTLAGSVPVRLAMILLPLVLLHYYRLVYEGRTISFLKFFAFFALLAITSIQNTTLTIIILFLHILLVMSRNTTFKKTIYMLLSLILIYSSLVILVMFPSLELTHQSQEVYRSIIKKTKPIFWEAQRSLYSFLSFDVAHRLLPLSAMPFDVVISTYIYVLGVLMFALTIFVLMYIFRKRFNDGLRFELIFWMLIYVLSVGFSTGKNLLDDLIVYIYKLLPIMAFLRSFVYYSNGIVVSLTILLSIYLFAILSYKNNSSLRKKCCLILPLIILILVFSLPWWNGDLGLEKRINSFDGKLGLLTLDEEDIHIYKYLQSAKNYPVHTLVIPSTGNIRTLVNNVSYVSPNVFRFDIATGILLVNKISKNDPLYYLSEKVIEALLTRNIKENLGIFELLGIKYILFIKNSSYVSSSYLNYNLRYIKKSLDYISTNKADSTLSIRCQQIINTSIFYLKEEFNSSKKIMEHGVLSFKKNFTICALVKVRNITNSFQVIVGKYDPTGKYYFNLILSPKGRIEFEWNAKMVSGNTIADNKWHFVCAVRKGSVGLLYVDGILRAMGVGSNKPVGVNSSYLFIGQRYDGKYLFRGIVKNILAFNTSLDSEHIWLLSLCLSPKLSEDTTLSKIGEGKFLALYELNIPNILIPQRLIFIGSNIINTTKHATLLSNKKDIAVLKEGDNLSYVQLDRYDVIRIQKKGAAKFELILRPHGKRIAIYLPYRFDSNWRIEVIGYNDVNTQHYRTLEGMNVWLIEFKQNISLNDTIKLRIVYDMPLRSYYEILLIITFILSGVCIYIIIIDSMKVLK